MHQNFVIISGGGSRVVAWKWLLPHVMFGKRLAIEKDHRIHAKIEGRQFICFSRNLCACILGEHILDFWEKFRFSNDTWCVLLQTSTSLHVC